MTRCTCYGINIHDTTCPQWEDPRNQPDYAREEELDYQLAQIRASLTTVADILGWPNTPEQRAQFTARYASLRAQYGALSAALTATMRENNALRTLAGR